MRIGIITAMSSEQEQLVHLLEQSTTVTAEPFQFIEGTINDNTMILMQCGIGKVNAAAGTLELIHKYHPDCIISTGVAGGIDSCLDVMDVVVSETIAYHDVWCGEGNEYGQVQGLPAVFEGNKSLLHTALSLETATKIHSGLICSGDKFITDRKELDQIKEKFPAGLAVDMESGAIAQICHLYHTPFISFRIISDTPGAKNHTQQYENFWGEMANRSFKVTATFLQTIPNQF